jgi:hypothetical protein
LIESRGHGAQRSRLRICEVVLRIPQCQSALLNSLQPPVCLQCLPISVTTVPKTKTAMLNSAWVSMT